MGSNAALRRECSGDLGCDGRRFRCHVERLVGTDAGWARSKMEGASIKMGGRDNGEKQADLRHQLELETEEPC